MAVAGGLVLLASVLTAQAQDPFRVTYTVDRSDPGQTKVSGVVFNENRQEVLDVSVTVEALDARGKVVARGIAYVSARIPALGSAPFVAKVPGVATAASFRASVSSYRAGLGIQAP